MRNLSLLSSGKALFGLFLLSVIVTSFAFYSGDTIFFKFVLLLSVPLFSLFYRLQLNLFNLTVLIFLLFFFLGNLFEVFFQGTPHLMVAKLMYLMGLGSLIFNVLPKFKLLRLNRWLRVYLVAVFAIGLCFLFEISHFFSVLFLRGFGFYLFVFQGLTLLLLCLLAFGACLHAQTKMNIRFFIAVVSFAFAMAMDYVTHYYLYDDSLVLLKHLFYINGLYFMFKFILGEAKYEQEKTVEGCQVIYSEIVAS